MQTSFVLGYPVHTSPKASLLARVQECLDAKQHVHVVTLNPEMVMRGEREPEFGRILKTADIVLPDGAGVVWALKRSKINVMRVPGIEFSEALMAHAAAHGEPVALIGAAPEVNRATVEQLCEKFPGLRIAYAHHGYFKSDDEKREAAQACADAKPRYVFIALGVPAQEVWIRQYRELFLQPAVFVGVGGSFDVWSGLKKRAPAIFLKLNLEWLYRITSEPFRIPRVYKVLPLFAWQVIFSHQS